MDSLQVPRPNQPAQQRVLLSEFSQPIESTLSDKHTTPSSLQHMYSDNHLEERMAQGMVGPGMLTGSEKKALEQTQSQSCEGVKLRRLSLTGRATSSEKTLNSKQLEHTPPSEREFRASVESRSAFKSRSIDAVKKTPGRTNSSTSNGSIVSALLNRYSCTIEPLSLAPKDVPHLSMSVSDLASRYEPIDEPTTPRHSPTDRQASIGTLLLPKPPVTFLKLVELELKEKECELRQHEQELNQKTRDFERDRMHFLDARGTFISASDTPRVPHATPFQYKRGSQSTSHLVLPPNSTSPQRKSQSLSRSQPSSPLPAKDHAPFCGCDTCSVIKYKTPDVSPSPRNPRPPEPPIILCPEEPRLHM
ncbi:hypothetical protein C8R48DRAFT_707156, partial [Suillus tomentosus]